MASPLPESIVGALSELERLDGLPSRRHQLVAHDRLDPLAVCHRHELARLVELLAELAGAREAVDGLRGNVPLGRDQSAAQSYLEVKLALISPFAFGNCAQQTEAHAQTRNRLGHRRFLEG